MTAATDVIPVSSPPMATAARTPGFFLGVTWMVLWLTNIHSVIQEAVPFMTYYVIVGVYLVYFAIAKPIALMSPRT